MKKLFKSKLYKSIIVHKRFHPFKHEFRYNVMNLYLDYDEISILDKNNKFFSYNKFNIFSYYDKDHGYRDNRNLKEFVANSLNSNKIFFNNLKLKILCLPRILGYVFNPLSIIFCYDQKKLIAIFYEVKNTFNEQHTYFFASKKIIDKNKFEHKCNKLFYVSPFIPMNGYYKFSTKIPLKDLSLIIEQFNEKKDKILLASQIGNQLKFSSKTIFLYLLKNPSLIFRVIFGIHYQAVKILFKGGKYYNRNKKINDTISFEGNL